MTQVKVDGSRLEIGGTAVELRRPVQDHLQTAECVVVVLEGAPDSEDVDNVLGFSLDGEKLWAIDNPVSNPTGMDAYQGVREENGRVWAISCASALHAIDLETGTVLAKRQWK